MQEAINAPSEKLQDKVSFIFNNLSLINMSQKKDDLSETLGTEHDYTVWLAQYLVMKRASIEPNFHTLYSSFLEKMSDEKLYEAVLRETFTNIRILLSSDKSIGKTIISLRISPLDGFKGQQFLRFWTKVKYMF